RADDHQRLSARSQDQQARRPEVPQEHRKRLAAGLLRRQSRVATASDARTASCGQARRSSHLTDVRTLVLGGIRSGKSQWAESAIVDAVGPGEPVRYVATGPAHDSDPAWSARVEAHRARRPAHWLTVETTCLATVLHDDGSAMLIDDLGGWLTAHLADPPVDELICAVKGFGAPLVV